MVVVAAVVVAVVVAVAAEVGTADYFGVSVVVVTAVVAIEEKLAVAGTADVAEQNLDLAIAAAVVAAVAVVAVVADAVGGVFQTTPETVVAVAADVDASSWKNHFEHFDVGVPAVVDNEEDVAHLVTAVVGAAADAVVVVVAVVYYLMPGDTPASVG